MVRRPWRPVALATVAGATADIVALLASLSVELEAPFLLMTPMTAIRLAAKGPPFDEITRTRTLFTVPVLFSNNVPADADSPSNAQIIAVDAGKWLVAEGAIEIGVSNVSTIQMQTAPDSPVQTTSTLVSLWQQGLTAILVQQYQTWKAANAGGAAVLTGCQY